MRMKGRPREVILEGFQLSFHLPSVPASRVMTTDAPLAQVVIGVNPARAASARRVALGWP